MPAPTTQTSAETSVVEPGMYARSAVAIHTYLVRPESVFMKCMYPRGGGERRK